MNIKERICDNCDQPYLEDADIMTEFNGIPVTVEQYRELTKDNPNVWHVCAKCIEDMPDAGKYFESGEVQRRPLPEKNN